nr:MAG: putative coat protein [Leviviridae sp.]
MLGTTFPFVNITAGFGSFATAIPDLASSILNLPLRNQDNFGSVYGYKGALHDHVVTIRNIRESPKAGQPLITRHSAEYVLTQRPTIVAGVATPAIPYVAGSYVRLADTGTPLTLAGMLAELNAGLVISSGATLLKMMNFES